MKDGEIKKNGDSRYFKFTMPDTYEEFKAQASAGTLLGDLLGINKSGWKELPTWLNKPNLLSDATCDALGIDRTSTPNDALKGIVNHVSYRGYYNWNRYNHKEGVTRHFKSSEIIASPANAYTGVTFYVSDNYTVNANHSLNLAQPVQEVTLTPYGKTNFKSLNNKYFMIKDSGLSNLDVLYYGNDQDANYSNNNITKSIEILLWGVANQDFDTILFSRDPNAYPSGVNGDYRYESLGLYSGIGAQISVGSYTGTGLFGSQNPNKLINSFNPKMIIIKYSYRSYNGFTQGWEYSARTLVAINGMSYFAEPFLSGSHADASGGVCSWDNDNNIFSWYSESATSQLNNKNIVYHYIALS